MEISIINKEPRTDSRLLASVLDHRHRTILENIDKNLTHLSELGSLPFETEVNSREDGRGGQAQRYAMLNEDQCYFLLTLMRNNAHVVKAKLELVKAFRDVRNELMKRDLARADGKVARLGETDAIKSLVEYATANGASKAEWYYANITKMTNSLLGIKAGTRDKLDSIKLKQLGVVETIVELAIRDGLNNGLDYQDIYKLAKERASMVQQPLALN